ncbi:methyl-accepting chemotaxis protein [Rivihabitans pingtungensis]|uniref:methyl-accepting chemotaxis protein n=1 Tax=Rivihabitans pingtungensis TaxID=1054498 RepID=UPI0023F025C2|nr:methyl-accepting chemotaxis protein [Rivihabitans pingtungensis]
MKVNLPVTQNEVFLDPARPIVTKTDLKGQITYANRAFIDISGFTENELIGVSHNIVRHPDMPPEAFADLWTTLKAGRPWSGLVKNRNKAGDFYWVEAYVSPITENGETIGYMSVRNAPKREDVAAAEALYRDVRDKRRRLPATPKGPGRFSLSLGQKLRAAYWGAACLMLLIALLPDSQSTLRWVLAGAGATFGLVVGWTLPQSFRVSIRALRRGLMRIREGNFTQPVTRRTSGGLGEALVSVESTRISLRALMADVLAAAGDTQTHAQNLRQRMAAQATRSHEQAQGVQQVAQTMETISQAAASISNSAEQARDGANLIREAVLDGCQRIDCGRAASTRAMDVVERSRVTMQALGQEMNNIGCMTAMIREIAEQTNLLALNAAIEAARAGESGRGFAVVADEVRKLAERSSQSTEEINAAVAKIGEVVEQATRNMDETVEEVQRGATEIESASDNLAQLIMAADEASTQAEQLAGVSQQQSQATHQIAATLQQVSVATEEHMQATDALSEASAQLAQTASDLEKLVSHFARWHATSTADADD